MIDHPEHMSGPEVLKACRVQAGRTQRDIANHLGITSAAVSEWERGVSNPTRDSAVRTDTYLEADGMVAAAFGYSTEPPPSIFRPGPPTSLNDVNRLRGRVDSLESELTTLRSQVVALARHVERQGHQIDQMTDAVEATPSDRASAGRARRPTRSDR